MRAQHNVITETVHRTWEAQFSVVLSRERLVLPAKVQYSTFDDIDIQFIPLFSPALWVHQ